MQAIQALIKTRKLQVTVTVMALTLLGNAAYRAGADDWWVMRVVHLSVKSCSAYHGIWKHTWTYEGQEQTEDYREFIPQKVGDYISFVISVPVAGRYSLQTLTYKDGKEGMYRFEVNGQPTGPEHDFYQSSGWQHGIFEIKAGTYTVTYRYIGQNEKSKGKGVKLGNLEFRPKSR
jgi:hypothetical protein